MDTTTDIMLLEIDKKGKPLESGKEYSLKSFLRDIKAGNAEVRLNIGRCEENKEGNPKWIYHNEVWVIRNYGYGWRWKLVYYKGETRRSYEEINKMLGYCAIDSSKVYL